MGLLRGGGLAVTISGDTATTGTDSTNSVTLSAGDQVSIYITGDGSASVAYYSLRFNGTTDGETVILGSSMGGLLSDTNTEYMMLSSYKTTEDYVKIVAPCAGTFKNLYVRVDTNPGDAATGKSRDFTLMVDGSPSALTTNILEIANTNQDTTHTVHVTAGQLVSVRSVPNNTPAISRVHWGVVFLADNTGDFILPAAASENTLNTSSDRYFPVMISIGYASSESNVETPSVVAFQAKSMYVHLSGVPTQTYTFTFRVGEVSKTLSVAMSGSDVDKSDTINPYSVQAGDKIDILISPSGGPNAVLGCVSICGFISPPASTGFILIPRGGVHCNLTVAQEAK